MPVKNKMAVEQKPVIDLKFSASGVLISTLLSAGFTLMFGTAFEFNFSVPAVVIFALTASVIFTVLFCIDKKPLTTSVLIAAPAAVTAMAVLDILDVQKGLMAFLYNMQLYSFYWIPGQYTGGTQDDGGYILAFILAYNVIAIALTTYFLTKRKNIPLSLLIYAPIFVCAVSNTVMLPDKAASITAVTGVFLLILAHAYRNKRAKNSGKILLALVVPLALFPILTGVIFPVDGYDKDELAQNILISMKNAAEEASGPISNLIDTALKGVSNPNITDQGTYLSTLFESSTNLKAVGPFNPTNEVIMTVRKNLNSEYPGSFSEAAADVTYLKIESLDIYKNNTLKSSRVNMAVYADESDLYQYEKVAPYTITIKPEIDNPIDIVPYYTDFYRASSINSAYVLPYNTTRLGQHTFAAGRIPVKTGMVYSEKYLNSYVYDTCLDVPKSTEMEIISNCNLPDWYLDVYHGYTTMSDAEKVRRVTEYVRDLHPYDENTDYPPNNVDFVPWFIKDAESGICVHYAATSMILLRLLGVPARYVRGYVDQDSVPGTDSVILASQSHAWFEFFVPEYGWIMGDATPGYDSIAAYSNIEKVASEYPELEQTNFAKGDTHFFNPDNTTETSGSSEETATETSASSDTSDTTASSDTTETTGSTDPSASDTKNTASPDQTSGNTGVPSGTSSSDKPADNSRDYTAALQALGNVFKTIFTVLMAIVIFVLLILFLRLLYVSAWRSRFKTGKPGERAVAYYHYYRSMSRIFKFDLPKKATAIAEKAAFAENGITAKELGLLIAECEENMSEIAKGYSRMKNTIYKFLRINIKS